MNETKKPAVRFKGFSVEWERHPMDELTTELHEYATLDSLYPLLTSSREGIMFQNEYRSNRTTENNKTLFSIVPYGKCTYRHMSDDDIFHFNMDYIFGRTDNPQGKLYEYKPKIQQNDPQMQKFVEMCFDPTSPMNARLKETLLQMLGEAKQ